MNKNLEIKQFCINFINMILEQQKILLQKSSHDKALFRKELIKSFQWLRSYEIFMLLRWVKEEYSDKYPDLIRELHQSFHGASQPYA